MYREKSKAREKQVVNSKQAQRMPPAKYLSSVEISNVLHLLVELSEITQSASSHALAKQLIAELGGPTWQREDQG